MSNRRAVYGCLLSAALVAGAARVASADPNAPFGAFDLSDVPATQDQAAAPAKEAPYKGARGLVTLQGMSGMFINPTSGTLNQGQFTAQYCFLAFADDSVVDTGHGLMLAYGITDWLEAGVFLNFADLAVDLDDPFVYGPFARVRLLKEKGWIPEVSIGGIFLDGNAHDDLLTRKELFVAASKRFEIDPDGFFRSFRLHAGVRRVWNDDPPILDGFPTDRNDNLFGYIGGELEFPYSISLVAETMKDYDSDERATPWAVGFQWKPTGVVGISIAAEQAPGEDRPGFWFGIGLNFKL